MVGLGVVVVPVLLPPLLGFDVGLLFTVMVTVLFPVMVLPSYDVTSVGVIVITAVPALLVDMVTLLLSLSIQRLLPDSDATPELEDDKVNLPAKSFPLMVRVMLFPTVTVLLVTDTS